MPVEAGRRVQYHGSLPPYHGSGTVIAVADGDHPAIKSDDGHRYVLEMDTGRRIYNVRRQSFDVITEE